MNVSVEKNLAKIKADGIEAYMEPVRKCKHRCENKCGMASNCAMCEHFETVEFLYKSFAEAPATYGILTEGWLHLPTGSHVAEATELLLQLETSLVNRA